MTDQAGRVSSTLGNTSEGFGDLDKTALRVIRSSKGDGIDSAGGRPFEKRSPTMRDGIGIKAGRSSSASGKENWKG